jgi:histidyl-tRNA synthetase
MMSRKKRLFVPGLPHLIKLRGHNYEPLFKSPEDYNRFLECLDRACALYTVRLYAWSLTPQRILLLLDAPDKEAMGHFMQYTGRSYVPWYNGRYHRRGALWESRYWSSPIEADAWFLLVKKYVEHQHREAMGRHSFADTPPERLSLHPCWLRLGATPEQRVHQYRQLCQRPFSPTILSRIETALEQNCLLATPQFSRSLEGTLARPLQPRSVGRPRKYYNNPVSAWSWLERQAGQLLQRYCYREIRMPLLERWEQELSASPFSAGTDELPLNHQALLRGDGTMGCLRIVANHQDLQKTSKLWYLGTMFRRSHQQKEAIRSCHQLGVEAFGYPGHGIELEQIALQAGFFRDLHLENQVELRLNTPGAASEFACFREALRAYYHPMAQLLSREQLRILQQTPERLLNDPDILLQRMAGSAPRLATFISDDSRLRFRQLCNALDKMAIPYTHDEALFPVNDYCHLVFEWHSDKIPEPGLLCRGGRYDHSASQLTGRDIHACGFAFMIEPIMQLLQSVQRDAPHSRQVDLVIIPERSRAHGNALLLGRTLRQSFPRLSIVNDCSQLRTATRQKNARSQGARFVLMVEGDEQEVKLIDLQNWRSVRIPALRVVQELSAMLML